MLGVARHTLDLTRHAWRSKSHLLRASVVGYHRTAGEDPPHSSSARASGNWIGAAGIGTAAFFAMGIAAVAEPSTKHAPTKNLPIYTRDQVAQHDTHSKGIWVTYKDGVYDITDFVANHPGGSEKIMLAAGKAVDPFWNLYRQHYSSSAPAELLAEMQIGMLDPNEAPLEVDTTNPYSNDPARHPGLVFHSTQPCNAELPMTLLDSWVTPVELFFVRHHHPVPHINQEEYRLVVKGPGVHTTTFSLQDLRSKFKEHTVTSTLQCGGNRRADMNSVAKTSGTSWGCGAISTARWAGVRVRDVLAACGLEDPELAQVEHVTFVGADEMLASVPVEKVYNPYGDVLLAYSMNGEPIPQDHGAPVRAIVPGHVGVRNVKWVTEVRASKEEATGMWQRGMAYKMLPSSVTSLDGIDVESRVSMQEQPVQSVIAMPQSGTLVEGSEVDLKGYSWSGGGRGIVMVDVSTDGGKTWMPATLKEGSEQKPNRAWAWTFWEAEVPIPAEAKKTGIMEICCRATDAASNSQPHSAAPIWNMRGLATNSWHKITLRVDQS